MIGEPWLARCRAVNAVVSVVDEPILSGLTIDGSSGVRMSDDVSTTVLWRPTGPRERELVRASGWRAWPPRLPDQPIFYPVLNEDYAIKIARDWNVPASGAGYVTRFHVETDFLSRYPVRQVGGDTILELWVPAEELDEFNSHIVGQIEVVHEFG